VQLIGNTGPGFPNYTLAAGDPLIATGTIIDGARAAPRIQGIAASGSALLPGFGPSRSPTKGAYVSATYGQDWLRVIQHGSASDNPVAVSCPSLPPWTPVRQRAQTP
jgi:hypothetical protein